MDIPVLYEDDWILAINKPVGVVVNDAQSVKGETVQQWAHKRFGWDQSAALPWGDSFESRVGIAHRIDKETSGLLLIAKTEPAFTALLAQFKDRTVKKSYRAYVHGILSPRNGEINAPIGRLPWNRQRFGVIPGGKEAHTRYSMVGEPFTVSGETYSEVALYPLTGRTHQLRVHMKYINHPILGDFLYAGRITARGDREWAPRVMLHAHTVSFIHPDSKETITLEAPIPFDMMSVRSIS